MARYVLKRLAIVPVLLLGIVTIAFIISRLLPADPIAALVGERNIGNPEVVAAARARWGLDGNVLQQYFTYVGHLFVGDLGTSFHTKSAVTSDLATRLPATLELSILALLIGTIGGIVLGVISASRKDKGPDHAARIFSLLGSSLPIFWTGLVFLFVFYSQLGVAPGPGRLSARVDAPPHITGFYTIDALLAGNGPLFLDALSHLILPAFILGWGLMGTISRLVRASMLDELNSDYVRTVRAKGIGEGPVLRHHVLRNSLTPVVTIVGFAFGSLIMGAVLVEEIFSWNGMGSYAVESARTLDYPAINGVTLLGGLIFLVASLVTDLVYAAIDPRVRLA
jgi:peptide/nickel transport system permease protein